MQGLVDFFVTYACFTVAAVHMKLIHQLFFKDGN